MAEMHDPQNPQDAEVDLRKGLLRRVAVAGVLVVLLLGGLAVFDALQTPPEEPPLDKVAVVPPPEPKPEEPAKDEAKAESKAEVAAEEKKTEEPPAEPERTAAPSGTLPPSKAERALTTPAQTRPASIRSGEPPLALQRAEPVRDLARLASPPPGSRHAPPSRPLTQAAEAGRQFMLQVGVFSNLANAEEMRAKLQLAGIPTQIEARVQVGPFATRQEAESAREKLRSLGMEGGMLTAIRK